MRRLHAIDALGDSGPLFHVWQEPPWAPHRGFASNPRGAIEAHWAGAEPPRTLAVVDGHLEWLAPPSPP